MKVGHMDVTKEIEGGGKPVVFLAVGNSISPGFNRGFGCRKAHSSGICCWLLVWRMFGRMMNVRGLVEVHGDGRRCTR